MDKLNANKSADETCTKNNPNAERTLSMNGKEDAAILLYSNLKNPYLP